MMGNELTIAYGSAQLMDQIGEKYCRKGPGIPVVKLNLNLQCVFAGEKVSLGIPGCTKQTYASRSREVIAPLHSAIR